MRYKILSYNIYQYLQSQPTHTLRKVLLDGKYLLP